MDDCDDDDDDDAEDPTASCVSCILCLLCTYLLLYGPTLCIKRNRPPRVQSPSYPFEGSSLIL
jgi:hypothetical protein